MPDTSSSSSSPESSHDQGSAAAKPQGWTNAFAKRSQSAFAEGFTADVILQASTITRPIAGIDKVKAVLAAASSIYESVAFSEEASNGNRTYLEWEARAFGGKQLLGVTVIETREDGKISNVAIHHRPLNEALAFSRELRKRVGATVGEDYFFS